MAGVAFVQAKATLAVSGMDTDDFYDPACFNPFHRFNRLGSISGSNRHLRHQAACWT
jgi:hypothetical protein